MNVKPDEVIRSLFYNKKANALITVSVYRKDNFSSLRCRSTPISYINAGMPDNGVELFETESLRWPGFVEFDDVNGTILTFSSSTSYVLSSIVLLHLLDGNATLQLLQGLDLVQL